MCDAATCDLGHIMTTVDISGRDQTETRCEIGGSSCPMDERRCRHDNDDEGVMGAEKTEQMESKKRFVGHIVRKKTAWKKD